MDAPARTLSVTRAAARFCALRGWAPVEQVPLPDGRRADILALLPSGDLVILEVKSCARDFLCDGKWQDYRAWCDRLYFAVDLDFPQALLPGDVGLLVAEDREAALLREAPEHRLASVRRRALTQRVAMLAAGRLAALADPAGAAEMRAALRLE
ncbi:MmcB family DNA repair protein [Roseomonas sp. CAU 1739]|uniref:MmcB family DNA repair protein n=1 Tax=Roseomonas sp. CAU 1739 TaxID=3140364 RepID=UPI00325BCD51